MTRKRAICVNADLPLRSALAGLHSAPGLRSDY